ncbi:MAG: hypothetical protein QF619_10735, partial [Candidatus Binatia bacterium]|nr:hypothetical protein [Candidatus Binatia bacterium]
PLDGSSRRSFEVVANLLIHTTAPLIVLIARTNGSISKSVLFKEKRRGPEGFHPRNYTFRNGARTDWTRTGLLV